MFQIKPTRTNFETKRAKIKLGRFIDNKVKRVMSLDIESRKSSVCPSLSEGCLSATGRCIGPVTVRQFTEEGNLITAGTACSKSVVQQLRLPDLYKIPSNSPQRNGAERLAILQETLRQYLSATPLFPETVLIESTTKDGYVDLDSEGAFHFVRKDTEPPISQG